MTVGFETCHRCGYEGLSVYYLHITLGRGSKNASNTTSAPFCHVCREEVEAELRGTLTKKKEEG